MESKKEIFFKPWQTAFSDDELAILQVSSGQDFIQTTNRMPDDSFVRYTHGLLDHSIPELRIKAFSYCKGQVFDIDFDQVSAYRVLDEHGLVDIWEAGERPNSALFRVGGHPWTKESVLSFVMEGVDTSWMIATAFLCVEVVADCSPIISNVVDVTPEKVMIPSVSGANNKLSSIIPPGAKLKRTRD
ncbi:hypothetical protein [Alterisphingorhabdus coralli]|uniref:Uncharacterized protein n=1 Tax=Alterisphingorhabdus coralli TaxID=3071408 RepID=A0AA97FAJ2_9SPHN|nr:hypothetical protein [Parasphingorhabdus sp. SCSIO 66989]WOE76297.1 hypothetical protein RB602_06180 [Parasphingorhabdus sp. SCSIO 66989]